MFLINFNSRFKIIIFFKKVKIIRFVLIPKSRFSRITKPSKKLIKKIIRDDDLNIKIKKV